MTLKIVVIRAENGVGWLYIYVLLGLGLGLFLQGVRVWQGYVQERVGAELNVLICRST